MRTILVTMLFGISVVSAAPAEAPSTEPDVTVNFTVTGLGRPVGGIGYWREGTLHEMTAAEFDRSPVYTYVGPRKMELHRMPGPAVSETMSDSGDDALAKVRPPPVGVVMFEPSISQATVLLSQTGAGYQAMVIPEDAATFPPGRVFLVNVTRMRLRMICDAGDGIVLKPKEHRLVNSAGRGRIDIELFKEQGDGWRRLKRNQVPVLADQQTIIAIVDTPAGGIGVEMIVLRQKPRDEKMPAPDAQPQDTIQP